MPEKKEGKAPRTPENNDFYKTASLESVYFSYPLVWILGSSLAVFILQHTLVAYDGSFSVFFSKVLVLFEEDANVPRFLLDVFKIPLNFRIWKYVGSFCVLELLLMRLIPGKEFRGPATATGHIPVYLANGFQCYALTLVACAALLWGGHVDTVFLFTEFGQVLSAMVIIAMALCTVLVIKGRYFPSTSDRCTSPSLINDFFWGTELYPRILGWDVKLATNCRLGLMFWAVGLLCWAHAQHTLYAHLSTSMAVSVALQLLYLTKFFWWETGYLGTMDIQHDRAGYYLCWGCLVWVPCIYTLPARFLVLHPYDLPPWAAVMLAAVGSLCVVVNYLADRQKQEVRQSGGACLVWGRPPTIIRATYTTGVGDPASADGKGGKVKHSLLLASGWWGLARHFHYLPELAGTFCWTLPAGLSHLMPWCYFLFLAGLLLDRLLRDDVRCRAKYGAHWDEYCRLVPFKVVPYVW